MHISRNLVLPALAAGALALAACGSSGGSGGSGGSAAGAPAGSAAAGGASAGSGSAATTVAVRSAGSAQVLTNASGRTLYVSDQENGKVLCKTSDCTAIWLPLTVSGSSAPQAPAQVTGTLGTIKRPDGKIQVTLDGHPLYTFSFDHSAGDTGGDGQKDSFDGTNFTWHTATPTGAVGGSSAASSSTSGGGGYGGY